MYLHNKYICNKKVPSLVSFPNDGINVRAYYAANENNKGTIFPSVQAL